MAVLVSAHQLEKSFGSRTLFKGITFSIDSGDRIGLIGPNGAGKSTLLKILAKLETPDEGDVSFNRGLRVGYLPQSPSFTEGASVFSAICESAEDPYDPMTLAKTEELISHLSLDSEKVNRDSLVETLSGGWQKKVALACQLIKEPQLLLLDEPTNHLDLESIFWLEEFLSSQRDLAVLTITHDRLFLQNVSNQIFDLDKKYKDGLLKVRGDYTDYLESRDIIVSGQLSQEEARKNDLRRETAWLRRGAKARQTKQKARIERAHDLKDEVLDLRARNSNNKIEMDLASTGRSPKKLIEATTITKSFGDRPLFKDLSLIISPKSRIGLLGRNGCGKSTLIKVLLGELTPDNGTVKIADQLQVSYFEQHRDSLNPKDTLFKSICPAGDYVHLHGKPVHTRSYLHRFHFRPEQFDMPVERLSGGEQSRLLIARLMLTQANILVLDEPTNDLDIATLDVLKEALDDFDGAVILVTHDRFFLEQTTDTILSFTDPGHLLPSDTPGELLKFAGYLQWQTWMEQRFKDVQQFTRNPEKFAAANPALARPSASSKPIASAAGAPPTSEKKKKLSFKEQHELDNMEATIQKAEAKLATLTQESTEPQVIANAKRLVEISAEMAVLQAEIDRLYARWSELS